jgi:hypothetical protein
MAVTQITFGPVTAQTNQGTGIPLMTGAGLVSQRLTPTAASQMTSISSPTPGNSLARVATDTAIWVKFDVASRNPLANLDHGDNQNGRVMVPANETAMFLVAPGVVAAIMTAS